MSNLMHYRFKDAKPKEIKDDASDYRGGVKALNLWMNTNQREPNDLKTQIFTADGWRTRDGEPLTVEELLETQMFEFRKRLQERNAKVQFNNSLTKYHAKVAASKKLKAHNGESPIHLQYLSQGRKHTLLSRYTKETGKTLDFLTRNLRWTNYRPLNAMSIQDIIDKMSAMAQKYLAANKIKDLKVYNEDWKGLIKDAEALKKFTLKAGAK